MRNAQVRAQVRTQVGVQVGVQANKLRMNAKQFDMMPNL